MMLILQFLVLLKIVFATKLTNCPPQNIKYEKTIGIRPSDNNNGLLLYESKDNEPITNECLTRCLANSNCISFVLYYNKSSCYTYNTNSDGIQDKDIILDGDVAWFNKICVSIKDCPSVWAFERVPGAILIGNNVRKLPNVMTREDCQLHCLNETSFLCRSAKFKILDVNNITSVGICTLSDVDRHLVPSSYRVSSYDDEYLENQCLKLSTNEFCTFEEYVNVSLSHTDVLYENISKTECQMLCDSNSNFHCRGYSLLPKFSRNHRYTSKYDCHIHSEDSKVHGPKLLKEQSKGMYYERAPCLNITVTCYEDYIVIKYKPQYDFNGKLYMKGYSEDLECFVLGHDKELVTLKIPLQENRCGITKANSDSFKTLLSATMILQYYQLIQTQADRIIKVGCIFGNDTKVLIGTGVNFTEVASNAGSTIINPGPPGNLPKVEMKIIDINRRTEVTDTQIGDELQLLIQMNQTTGGNFDIWAGHLIAMTENGQDSILLLDDRGCPTNLNIFPALTKNRTNGIVQLWSIFQAFKFSSSPIIRFSVIVQFCSGSCPIAPCDNTINYHSKRRRATKSSIIETTNGTTVLVSKDEFYGQEKKVLEEMPLEYIIIVRNAKVTSDKLIYGESNKILVAGYDYVNNEVCFDYSMIIGLVISWAFIQIIFLVCCFLLIRKYKKHYEDEYMRQSLEDLHRNFGLGFSNLDNRRVRFADTDYLT